MLKEIFAVDSQFVTTIAQSRSSFFMTALASITALAGSMCNYSATVLASVAAFSYISWQLLPG